MIEDLSGNPTFLYEQNKQEISFCLSQPNLLITEDLLSYITTEDSINIIVEESI